MGASRAGLGVVVALLLAGCAADGVADGTTTGTPSPSEFATEPTPQPTPSSPENGIPADLALPGQDDGKVEPRTDAGRLYHYICLDTDQQWTLGAGFVEAQTVIHPSSTRGEATTIDKLAAYPSTAQAARAVRGLLAQVEMCGDRGNHVGAPSTWRASETTGLEAADESARLTYRTEGVIGTVITVVRVGRAVFYIDRREQYDDGVPTDESTVAAFIPTLAKAFS